MFRHEEARAAEQSISRVSAAVQRCLDKAGQKARPGTKDCAFRCVVCSLVSAGAL